MHRVALQENERQLQLQDRGYAMSTSKLKRFIHQNGMGEAGAAELRHRRLPRSTEELWGPAVHSRPGSQSWALIGCLFDGKHANPAVAYCHYIHVHNQTPMGHLTTGPPLDFSLISAHVFVSQTCTTNVDSLKVSTNSLAIQSCRDPRVSK